MEISTSPQPSRAQAALNSLSVGRAGACGPCGYLLFFQSLRTYLIYDLVNLFTVGLLAMNPGFQHLETQLPPLVHDVCLPVGGLANNHLTMPKAVALALSLNLIHLAIQTEFKVFTKAAMASFAQSDLR